MMWRNKWVLLSRVLIVAIVVQAVIVAWGLKPWLAGDSPSYLLLAKNLDAGFYGEHLANGWAPDSLRPPGYPILLWFLLYALNLPLVCVVVSQVGAYLASLFLVDRMLETDGLKLAFRLFAAAYPFAAAYSANIMTESWAMLALSSSAYLLTRPSLRSSSILAAGGILGLASLFRTDLLLLPIGIAFFLGISFIRSGSSFTNAIGRASLILVAAAAMLAPYAIWNLQNFGRLSPAPYAAAVGNSLYTASWQETLELQDFNSFYGGEITPHLARSGYLEEITRLNRSIGAPALTPPDNPIKYPNLETRIASNKVFGLAALRRIEQQPASYAWHVTKNLWLLWNTSNFPSKVPAFVVILLLAISYTVYITGMIGGIVTLVQSRVFERSAIAVVLLLYPFAVHIPAHLEARYTAAARPLLLMFAAVGTCWIWSRVSTIYLKRIGQGIGTSDTGAVGAAHQPIQDA